MVKLKILKILKKWKRERWVKKIMKKTEDKWFNQDPKYHNEDGMVW